jgi:hypothetical protein
VTRCFDDILNECVEQVLRGEALEHCLQRYPEQAAELESLLRVAVAARRTSSAVEPRPEFKARTRYEIQSRRHSKDREAEAKKASMVSWMPRWAVVTACLALVLVFAGTGTVAASSDSVPGERLYAVKTAAEQVQWKLTFSQKAKARLQAGFAERRAWEMAQLAKKGRTGQLESLATKFTAHLAKMEQLAAQIRASDPEDGERISELREILYTNMARDLVMLDAAEAKAPWRARTAIAVAKFRLMQEYDKAIDALDELQDQQGATSGSSGDPEAGAQLGGTGSVGGLDGGMVGGGSTGSGQQGQMTSMGFRVQAGSPDATEVRAHGPQPS